MSISDIQSAIDALENAELRQILTNLLTNLTTKDDQIKALENKFAELEACVDDCEIYSSKDCIIMENIPIKNPENGNVSPLSHQVCDFLKYYLNYDTNPGNFKACHPLGSWKNEKFAPAVIVKFIYLMRKTKSMDESLGCRGLPILSMGNQFILKKGSRPNRGKSK